MLTNKTNIPLSLAVMLATDTYDYVLDPEYISATALLRPMRSIVLERNMDRTILHTDISELIASKIGTSVHDSLEKAWVNNHVKALSALGFDDAFISRILINPDRTTTLPPNALPVYLEQRRVKNFEGFKIGGKFDLVMEGALRDLKTTGVYSWINQSNREHYIQQGSIYRWLNQDIVTESIMYIDYIFTNWNATTASKAKVGEYPPHKALAQEYPLMSINETEAFIASKLDAIRELSNKEQYELPLCTKEELWQGDTVYKYYANPEKTLRATKNFTALHDAEVYRVAKGKGIVKTVAAEAKRCSYCNARSVCTQAAGLEIQGILKSIT